MIPIILLFNHQKHFLIITNVSTQSDFLSDWYSPSVCKSEPNTRIQFNYIIVFLHSRKYFVKIQCIDIYFFQIRKLFY